MNHFIAGLFAVMKDNLVSFFGRVFVSIDNPVLSIDRCILANAVCFPQHRPQS